MKLHIKFFVIFELILAGLFSPQLHAELVSGESECKIRGTDFADFTQAVSNYNRTSRRSCKDLIGFLTAGVMKMTQRVDITGTPVSEDNAGNPIGTLITRSSNITYTLDASGLGDCPIRVKVDSRLEFIRITLKVDNVLKAICDLNGVAVYNTVRNGHVPFQTNSQKAIASIEGSGTDAVTIIPSDNDSDRDGIFDEDDACPEIPDKDPSTGMNRDTDNDGLADACEDPSPNDKDNDGVLDRADKCPDTPANFTFPRFNGCPGLTDNGDLDADTKGDACDDDIDGDGLTNVTDPSACDPDTDGDGVCDGPGAITGVCTAGPDACNGPGSTTPCTGGPNPTIDTDGDGLTDSVERASGTSEFDPDSDNDGMCDGPNAITGVCTAGPDGCPNLASKTQAPCTTPPANTDPDGDGLTNTQETAAGTDPNDPDTDGDGACDGPTRAAACTSAPDCAPLDPTKSTSCSTTTLDTDHDGLTNTDEIARTHTKVDDPDTDSDGICDGPAEISDVCTMGPDPCPLTSKSTCTGDMDGDGVPDGQDNCPFLSNPKQGSCSESPGDPTLDKSGNGGGCGLLPNQNDNLFSSDSLSKRELALKMGLFLTLLFLLSSIVLIKKSFNKQ